MRVSVMRQWQWLKKSSHKNIIQQITCLRLLVTHACIRYVNDDDARQVCYVDGVEKGGCLNHNANLVVDVGEVVQLVKSLLNVQQAAMTRHSFDEST